MASGTVRLAALLALAGLMLATGCARRSDAAGTAVAPPPAPPPPASAAPAVEAQSDLWYGAFLQGQRIGYLHLTTAPVERDGQPCIEIRATEHVVLALMGQKMEQLVQMVTTCQPDWRPITATITMSSGGRESAITARYFEDHIDCEKTSADGTTTHRVEIPPGIRIVGDVRAALADGRLDVGETVEMYEFNPLTLKLDKNVTTALREETIELGGEKVEAVVSETKSPMATFLSWTGADGNMLRMEMNLLAAKLEFQLEDEATVMASAGKPGDVDLLTATALRPDKPITDPRRTNRLVLRVSGLDKLAKLPDDEFIRITPDAEGWSKVTITSLAESEEPGAPVPVDDAAMAEYLKPAAYIESDAPEMAAKVKEILGDDPPRGTMERARLVHAWVHGHIKWQADIGLLRSALEILKDPAGVCRDAAALYTGLARAAGVPTRVCAGVLYMTSSFAGHAWAESWDGERWVPFDPTRPTPFVDATHLKLAEGAAYTCMFDMMPALGGMQIEVLEQSTLP